MCRSPAALEWSHNFVSERKGYHCSYSMAVDIDMVAVANLAVAGAFDVVEVLGVVVAPQREEQDQDYPALADWP